MFQKKYQSLFASSSSINARNFETFVNQLLILHLAKQEKVLETGTIGLSRHGSKVELDAFAREGFDCFSGPTIIEVKFHTRISTLALLSTIKRILAYASDEFDKFNILIICVTPVEMEMQDRIQSMVSCQGMKKLVFWGPEDIEKLAVEFPDQTNIILDSISHLTPKKTLAPSSDNWTLVREGRLKCLADAYHNKEFSLFLGAGVSASAGMPAWSDLINSLYVKAVNKSSDETYEMDSADLSQLAQQVRRFNDRNPIIDARHIRRKLSTSVTDDSEFIEAVRKTLYELRKKENNNESPLLKSISSLCTPSRERPKVRSVVTYNFDDLLERELILKKLKFKSVTAEDDTYKISELPVHHAHGYLPEESNNGTTIAANSLVFSEECYHRIYADPYHWSNIVQLNSLRDNVCLMVGLSMTDPNLRRLLEISVRNRKKPKHFAFMKRLSVEEFFLEPETIDNISTKKRVLNFLNGQHNENEVILNELGVTTIWYERYDEIPDMINQLTD